MTENLELKQMIPKVALPASPSLTKRVIEHQIIMQENEQKTEAEEKSKLLIEAYHFLESISPETIEKELPEYTKTITESNIKDIFRIYKNWYESRPEWSPIFFKSHDFLGDLILTVTNDSQLFTKESVNSFILNPFQVHLITISFTINVLLSGLLSAH